MSVPRELWVSVNKCKVVVIGKQSDEHLFGENFDIPFFVKSFICKFLKPLENSSREGNQDFLEKLSSTASWEAQVWMWIASCIKEMLYQRKLAAKSLVEMIKYYKLVHSVTLEPRCTQYGKRTYI